MGAVWPWTPPRSRSAPKGNPPGAPHHRRTRSFRGVALGERRVGAGTAGAGFGTVWYHRWPRPISGPPAAVFFPGLLVSYGTTDHGKPTALGRIRSQSLYSCLHNFLGEVRLANTLRPGGGPGKGREPRRLSPFRGRRQLIPEPRYQLLAAQPDPTYVHPPVRVGSIEAAHWASPRCH